MIPFHFGTADQFTAARETLTAAGFTEAGICERVGIRRIHDFQSAARGRDASEEIRDALDLLIRLFLEGAPVAGARIYELLPTRGRDALRALGLLDQYPHQPGHAAASVMLYPVESLYIASDVDRFAPGRVRPDGPDRADHVFSAITPLTGTFVDQLPRSPCERFLEICAGTGIAALVAAPRSGHCWAVDITERSTAFAEFNARLNAIDNVTALQGDLYAPVAGLRFDRIVAHPPYVPSVDRRMIYRDGGADGEEILRRIVEGLPDHLAPGGRFYGTCMATDREGAPLEDRLRALLGARQGEFDVLVVSHSSMHPTEYYSRLAAAQNASLSTVEQHYRLFRELGAERIVYASMAIQRHGVDRPAFTLRRDRAEGAGGRETAWLLDWSTTTAEADVIPALLDARPSLSSHARLQVTHRVAGGEWEVESCQVRVQFPFARAMDVSRNTAMLLTLFDGSRTTREILQRVREAGALAEEVTERVFAEFVRGLVGEGVLEVEGAVGAEEGLPELRAPLPG